MRYTEGVCDLVILQIFSPMRVGVVALLRISHVLIYPLAVADTSVMLALMAGRNAGAGVTLVKEGKVC